ncbi:uncharacterized protein [Triticum aestivum]|uniref:uncharacterized protein n=1 Tax=Triticum aestivum TaxID=4565 RepID=UPI001D035C18|nr:uncharacterized protein LOC123039115 [Triticum aestivum]
MDGQNSCTLRCWKQITKCWYIPEEEPSTDQDLLPVLGMLILDTLASFDIENCIEINKATGLVSKIIDFTSNRTDMTNISETDQALLKGSSLRLLRRLVSTQGKFGVTLRQEISEHPFLLSNLAVILEDGGSSQELRELTAEILRNISMDANARDEIGKNRVIISGLMHAFLNREAASSTYSDKLRKVAGQALAVLAMDSANNCSVMLAEPGYIFIKELTFMIHGDMYRYVAASLLRSMCIHTQPKLGNSELKEISHILREVLEGIMDADGAELEVLVGLSSQICNAIPGDFVRELEHGQIKERFINRLVCALNSNMTPAAHCPGIRRVIVEHAIHIMECNPSYTDCFNECWMMEALLRVEHTPSRAEKYRFFMGDAGLMEHSMPLSALVARAKELMGRMGEPRIKRLCFSTDYIVALARLAAGWKGHLMPVSGWRVLVRCVLSVMSSFTLTILVTLKKFIKDIDRVCRRFLHWAQEKELSGSKCEVNWQIVTSLVDQGNLGIPDITR